MYLTMEIVTVEKIITKKEETESHERQKLIEPEVFEDLVVNGEDFGEDVFKEAHRGSSRAKISRKTTDKVYLRQF